MGEAAAKDTTPEERLLARQRPGAWRVESQHGDIEVVEGVEYVFDAELADRACNFFGWFLVHHEGSFAGKPFELEGWQRSVVRCAFGWINRATGFRRYRTIFLFVPRKNGKSTWAAGCALYLTFADDEPAAQVYSAASDREQAGIVFNIAKAMVQQSAELRRMANLFQSSIAIPETRSLYKAISSDARTKHGFNSHAAVVDELHAHPNRDLYDVLVTSMGAREQPMTIVTTTAGFDRHSVCFEQYTYAKKVDQGEVVDPQFLPVIFEASKDEDWTAEETWRRANPNYGVSIKPDFIRSECRRAKEIPGYENTFKRLYLNIWTEQASRWLPMETWRECVGPARTPAWWNSLRHRECWVGIDLSSTTDLTAMVAVFPDAERRLFDVVCRFWIPKETARLRAERDKVPYLEWIREGWITETEGSATDQTAIKVALDSWQRLYKVREVAVDRWEATRLISELEDEGYKAFAHGQGYASMSGPSKALERSLLAREIRHGGHPVLEWNAGNAAILTDPAGNIKPAKDKSSDRIDGVVAMIMALGRAMLTPESNQSAYTRKGKGLAVIDAGDGD